MTLSGIPSGATPVYAVVGDPIRHSLSPRIHNRWIREAGLDAIYVALPLQAGSPPGDFEALARSGLAGLNVTAPHKLTALRAASRASDVAQRIGAANTLVREGGGWMAHNTDAEGFHEALRLAAPEGVRGARVLMIGAGGAARAAADVLHHKGADLVVVNRTRARAEALCADLAPDARTAGVEDFAGEARLADLIVQTTSASKDGAALPELPQGGGRPFLDLSYGDAAAAAFTTAGGSGWTVHDGLPMLVGQAGAAFRLWFGRVPDMQTALADCRAALARVR